MIDFWNIWNWKPDKPMWGDLTKYHPEFDHLFIGRKNKMARISRRLLREKEAKIDNILMICGSPGVGKSTLVDHLLRNELPGDNLRVSLIGYTQSAYDNRTRLTVGSLLDLFSRIEFFLLSMLEGNQKPLRESRFFERSKVLLKNLDNHDFESFIEIFKETVLPDCERIHKLRDSIPQRYLAIDDVDYLLPNEQVKLIGLFCTIAAVTSNPRIIYSARPEAAGIAKNRVTELTGDRVGEPIRIDTLSVKTVLESRITDGGKHEGINPFSNPKVIDFIEDFSNGNLRTVFKFVSTSADRADNVLSKKRHIFSLQDLLDIHIENPVKSREGLLLSNAIQTLDTLPNPFWKYNDNDSIPYLFTVLATFDVTKARAVDTEFLNDFTKTAKKLNPSSFSSKSPTMEIIEEVVSSAHKLHLIRRREFTNVKEYLSQNHMEHDFAFIRNTRLDLTPKGLLILTLCKNESFQETFGLKFWRHSIQNFIKDWNPKISKPLQLNGSPIEEVK